MQKQQEIVEVTVEIYGRYCLGENSVCRCSSVAIKQKTVNAVSLHDLPMNPR